MIRKAPPAVVGGLIIGALVFGLSQAADACSRIFWSTNDQAMVVGRTMDLFMDDKPRLVYLPRGIARKGLADDTAQRWTSKYASVAVTGLDTSVTDGMNEHGLAVNLLYLHGTDYEPADQRPTISNGIWAQYVLDNFTTVTEALDGLRGVRVVSRSAGGHEWPLHLALEDATGDSAIIEYIKGQMVVHHGKEYTVMTNEPSYDEQLANVKQYKLFGGELSMPGDIDPKSRFVRATSYLKTLPAPADYREAVAYLAGLVRSVMVPFGAIDTSSSNSADTWPTRWITLADLSHKRYFFLSAHSPNVFWVDLDKFDPASSTILAVDPQNPELNGDVSAQMTPFAPIKTEYPPPL